MIHLKNTTVLSTVMAFALVVPAMAAHAADGPKKTKEITELVGYDVTEAKSLAGKREARFVKMDKDASGSVDFKEFRDFAVLDNEYEIFSEIDVDQSKSLTMQEFASYEQGKGTTTVESELHGKVSVKGTNLKSKPYVEKHYYVPVEPTVVDVQPIEQDKQ